MAIRQWFVCGPCWGFIAGYQKSIAATAGIQEWWASKIKPKFSHLTLLETEPVLLLPYARAKRTKLQSAPSNEVLDFIVLDESKNPPVKLFHIEQKTGPGSIEDIKEFQLDVNDFNDIAGAMNTTQIPSYIVHVQVKHEYEPPTRRTTVANMWWTDLFAIRENQKRIAARRGEEKKAVFFRPGAFKSIDTFTDEIQNAGYTALTAKLKKTPIELLR